MVRADFLLLGYFRFRVAPEEKVKVSDIFLRNGMSVSFDKSGGFMVGYRQKSRVERLLTGKVSYEVSEPRGIFGFLVSNKKRYGAIFGIVFVLIIAYFSSRIVWDVRIEGADGESEEKILEELSMAGLSEGKLWKRLDRAEIEIKALGISDSVGWLNINRRGNVAYVKVSKKELHAPEQKQDGFASIVAARDCVIEEIIVKSGYATVKKGESVRAGEVLISGVIPTELGGGLCYAEGEVIGRYPDRVSVVAERQKEEKSYGERELLSLSVNFFGFNINIFKKTRQSEGLCDIIKEKERIKLLKRLPISVEKSYLIPYETVSVKLSDEEMTALASERLCEALADFLKDKEPKRLSAAGEFFEGGYRMVCDTVVSSDVTEIKEFFTE
jgi:similar to stage IV sporulation protein